MKAAIAIIIFGGYMGAMTTAYNIGLVNGIGEWVITNIIPIALAVAVGVASRSEK